MKVKHQSSGEISDLRVEYLIEYEVTGAGYSGQIGELETMQAQIKLLQNMLATTLTHLPESVAVDVLSKHGQFFTPLES